jgi:ubiquinone/menaquinone biosynthesis C-methylase UbiE
VEESYALKYHRLEAYHWWFLGRRDIIYRLIKDYNKNTEIFEIGCSGGVLIESLRRQGFRKLHGIDNDEKAIEICRQRGINDVRIADAQETGFEDQRFDVVIASDILEHIKDESKAVSEWYRILKPSGKLFIFVPAFRFLWSKHDEANHHYRRYSKAGLVKTLENKRLKVERSSYWNFSLFLPISLMRLSQRILPGSKRTNDQLYEGSAFMNKALGYLLTFENKLLSTGINFPVGISVFAIARKI